jgi:hypothetical protein
MYQPIFNFDIPIAEYTPTFTNLEERVAVALNTLYEVQNMQEPTDEDRKESRNVFNGGRTANDELLSRPGVVMHLAAILDEYDKVVVKSANQLRTYVTNKLVLESENQDPRIRIKALEMLGKISDVGLFTDKTEITMRHRPTEELEQMLRERLTKVIEGEVNEAPMQMHTTPLDITDVIGRQEAGIRSA